MPDFAQKEGILRPMGEADLALVLNWRNHPDIRRFMLTQHEISLAEHSRWFAGAANDTEKHLLVFELTGMPSGFVHFSREKDSGTADWGFYLAPNAPKGTGRELGVAALNYAFESIDLHKVCGQALDFNEPSIRFHLSLGFREEGVLREQHQIAGRYHDLICFGLLKSEWLDQQDEKNG